MVAEVRPVCPSCGKIFIESINIISDKHMKERTRNRREGIDADQLDG